jgi:general secretion pathway protein G
MKRGAGFTLLEMLVVLAVMGVLVAAARPLVELATRRQHEAQLREGLRQIRSAIDAYQRAVADGSVLRPADAPASGPEATLAVYPARLALLVDGVPVSAEAGAPRRHFLRRLPRDPFDPDRTQPAEATWAQRASDSPPDDPRPGRDVFDVRSRSEALALDGSRYSDW